MDLHELSRVRQLKRFFCLLFIGFTKCKIKLFFPPFSYAKSPLRPRVKDYFLFFLFTHKSCIGSFISFVWDPFVGFWDQLGVGTPDPPGTQPYPKITTILTSDVALSKVLKHSSINTAIGQALNDIKHGSVSA